MCTFSTSVVGVKNGIGKVFLCLKYISFVYCLSLAVANESSCSQFKKNEFFMLFMQWICKLEASCQNVC